MPRRHTVPDPIAGTIELPYWLIEIKDEPAIRRMLFIRQLGLKAYVDFPRGNSHPIFSCTWNYASCRKNCRRS